MQTAAEAPTFVAESRASQGRRWPARRIAVVLFAGIALVQLAFSPLDLRGMGYSDEEVAASFRLLSWISGEPQPASAPPLLSPQGIVTRHGILEPFIKLPFAAAGRVIAPLFPDSPRFAERFVAVFPILETALLAMLLFLWAEQLTGKPLWGLTLALGAAFCTMLWPYAYIGLEPTQALALLLAGYWALARDAGAGGRSASARGRTLGFVAAASIAVAVKSTGLLLLPAVAFLVQRFFRRRGALGALGASRRPILAASLTLLTVLAVVSANKVLRSYSIPTASELQTLREFVTTDPLRVASSMLMLLFSGNKGVIVYAPLAVLGLAALSAAWKRHRELAIFTLLVFASLLGGFSVVGIPAEETWGPRYLYCALPPLLLCLAAAWGSESLPSSRRLVLAAALLAGFGVSALGSLFYYGRLLQTARSVDQATLEALWGDPVWNPVALDLRLARLWLAPRGTPTLWTPKHLWWFARPAGLPPDRSIDLAPMLEPQPVLLRRSTRGRPWLLSALGASLVAGLAALAVAGHAAARPGGAPSQRSGPLLSAIARRRKIAHFLAPIPKEAAILEVGSGSGWVGDYLRRNGWTGYRGLDVVGPADLVGDIRQWRSLGLQPESFDVIVAFEVVEHVDCFRECHDLLKPGGRLLLTSPVPRLDWVMKVLEFVGLNQRRTSPHDHLVSFADLPWSGSREIRTVGWLAQWGTFTKRP